MTDDDAFIDPELARAASRRLPAVAGRASSLGLGIGIAAIIALGAGSFYALNNARTATPDAIAASTAPIAASTTMPPPPTLAPAPVAIVDVVPPPAAPMALPPPLPPPPPVAPPRAVTSALVVDLSGEAAAVVAPKVAGAADKLNPNEAFAARISGVDADTVSATRLASNQLVVAQGSIIVAVLETAINSDLPGQVRAVVSRNVLGFDGSTVLIPRGSRLIGQYSSGIALGQSRAFVIWNRLLRPDGVSIQLGSSATDELGTAGLGGKVNSHFLRRFGAATLLSVITAGLDFLSNSALNGGGSVIVGNSSQATQLAGIALQRQIDIPPTIRIAQGTPVRVLVARDLDFTSVSAARR